MKFKNEKLNILVEKYPHLEFSINEDETTVLAMYNNNIIGIIESSDPVEIDKFEDFIINTLNPHISKDIES